MQSDYVCYYVQNKIESYSPLTVLIITKTAGKGIAIYIRISVNNDLHRKRM